MGLPVIIRGTFKNQVFVPEGPLPTIEGRAELIVYQEPIEEAVESTDSIFACFGKAVPLRSAKEIDAQIKEERDSWDSP